MGRTPRRGDLVQPLLGRRGEAALSARHRRARRTALLATGLALAASGAALAEPAHWTVEASLGAAWSAATPLRIHQTGHPDLEIDARWDTRASEFPLYYAARAARWRGERAWALDLVHHKIHLRETTPEVTGFAVSHGYNLLTLQRLWRRRELYGGVGAGVVIAHPENRVRSRTNPAHDGVARSGYHLTGPTGALFAGMRAEVRGGWSVGAEARITGSRARVPVADGDALAPNLAFHLHAGVAFRI